MRTILSNIAIIIFTLCLASCHERPSHTLPNLYILCDDEIDHDYKTSCELSVDSTESYSVRIKSRGGYSYYHCKKHSYTVEFSHKIPLCDLPADKDWILNASYIDKTMMRHKICYDLYRQMSPNNLAPLCTYANIFINGSYEGLYVVMQKLDKSVLITDADYMSMIFKEPCLFRLSTDKAWDLPEVETYGQKYPKPKKEDCSHVMDSLRSFILNAPDETFIESIGDYFDLDSIIDWHLFLLFANAGDNVKKNFYLYKPNADVPFRIALWDCDHCFGRDCDNEPNMMQSMADISQNILLNRLNGFAFYREKLKTRWFYLRENHIFSADNLQRMITENDHFIHEAIERNFERWPVDASNYYDAANYEEEKALLLQFVTLCTDYYDNYFSETADY